MQKFCTHDGGRLVPDIDKPQTDFDPNATVHADLSKLDIPATPPAAAPPPARQPDLNATLAGAPPPPPSANAFRPSDNATSGIPPQQTTRLSQPLPPQQPQPHMPAPHPPEKSTPPQPQTPAPFPTLMAPPPPQLPPTTGAPVQPSTNFQRQAATTAPPSTPLPPPNTGTAPFAAPNTGPIQPPPAAAAAIAPKKSKTGLMLAIAGVFVLLLVVGGAVGTYFYLNKDKTTAPATNDGGGVSINPTLNSNSSNPNGNTNTGPSLNNKPAQAPPNSIKFENSQATLDGKLAEHYVDFYFFYPQSWQKSAKAGVAGAANFVEVERRLPPDYTQENITISWYDSKGTVEADLAGKLPALIKESDANLAKNYPEYQKVSEGKTTINGIDGYEFRFKAISRGTDKGDINIWGRVVYLPPGDEESTKGVTLYMLTTSLAPELERIEDVGVKGELPMILNSFTLGKS